MKIALISPTIDPRDGYGNITKELTTELSELGLELTLFLPKSQREKAVESHLFPIEYVLPEYIFRIFQPKAIGYFNSLQVQDFDIVHSLFAFPYCILGARSAKRYGKPFIMGAQGTHGVRPLSYVPEKWLLKSCYKQAAAIQVPSMYTKEQICKYAGQDYAIDVIHNGVRFNRFQHNVDRGVADIRAQYPHKKIITTVGGLWGRKGHDLVLYALAKIMESRNDIVYVIVGDGNAKTSLQELATELGVSENVDFVGRKSGGDLVAYFKACDIYVHTPKVIDKKFEGFGIVYLEASACGKPIVATDAGGIRDAVINDKTGLIAEDGDINGISKSILTLLENEELAKHMGNAGLQYAKDHDWGKIALSYQNLYQRVSE